MITAKPTINIYIHFLLIFFLLQDIIRVFCSKNIHRKVHTMVMHYRFYLMPQKYEIRFIMINLSLQVTIDINNFANQISMVGYYDNCI